MSNLRFMAYSLGQHTYEEKGEEQSWVTDTFSRVDVYTKSVVEHQEKLRMDLRVRIWRRRSLHGTSVGDRRFVSSSNSMLYVCSRDSHKAVCHTKCLPQLLLHRTWTELLTLQLGRASKAQARFPGEQPLLCLDGSCLVFFLTPKIKFTC